MPQTFKVGNSCGYVFLNKILSNLALTSIVFFLNLGFSRKLRVASTLVFDNSAYDNAKSNQHGIDSQLFNEHSPNRKR